LAEVTPPHEIHEQSEEHGEKTFSRRVALLTAIYAVVLAVAGLGGKYAMKEMLLSQQQASDQWAYYQAKVIREHLNRGNKILLESQLADPSPLKGAERAKAEALAKKFADEEKRMAGDKKDIEKEARKLEHERDLYRTKDPYFDYAEVLLQIAIVCSSVAILATSRPMVGVSLVLAVIGALSTLNGFLLIVKIGFLTPH
jgi:Skp family chaperone for outer membrane proteins